MSTRVLLQRPDFARNLMQSLRDDNIQPQQIALEITEQDFVRTADASPANIVALADAGIRVVIDDFGTGFSNFGYLALFRCTRSRSTANLSPRLASMRGPRR